MVRQVSTHGEVPSRSPEARDPSRADIHATSGRLTVDSVCCSPCGSSAGGSRKASCGRSPWAGAAAASAAVPRRDAVGPGWACRAPGCARRPAWDAVGVGGAFLEFKDLGGHRGGELLTPASPWQRLVVEKPQRPIDHPYLAATRHHKIFRFQTPFTTTKRSRAQWTAATIDRQHAPPGSVRYRTDLI